MGDTESSKTEYKGHKYSVGKDPYIVQIECENERYRDEIQTLLSTLKRVILLKEGAEAQAAAFLARALKAEGEIDACAAARDYCGAV